MTKQLERDAGTWPAIILYISVASALSGAFVYLATSPAKPVVAAAKTIVHRAVPRAAPAPPVADDPPTPPVQFANPFDPSEIFEFPAGTSETEAKQAVADMLLQRARDRQSSLSKITHGRRRTASLVVPVT
jgi:hypothetical protein